ncbi:MAG TPA: L-serine ammonia-lyase, iron-sulfur-dependent, subunit alpha [Bacillota bacterium]|nr:L-serine ammonia-lyase, iron-sulfur-dependent, subunit alpha [Bacillota bacterium]
MGKQPPSIFNDVIGPVMRGPSSSHTAAAVRIGRLARQLVSGRLKRVKVEFDPDGSLATTYHGQGSDMGLVGGLLGYSPEDESLPHSLDIARRAGLEVTFEVVEYGASHPNTYRMTLLSDLGEQISATAISTGGGMISYEAIEGFPVTIAGDFFETLVFCTDSSTSGEVERFLRQNVSFEYLEQSRNEIAILVIMKTAVPVADEIIASLTEMPGVKRVLRLYPVLPVLSAKDTTVPFLSSQAMLDYCDKDLSLYELALLYESARGHISKAEVFDKMQAIVFLMQDSIRSGLAGTDYKDRILGRQSHLIAGSVKEGRAIPGDALNIAISYITALMEVKSSMGVIVAAPTAGSCGALPGTIIGVCHALGLPIEEATKAMLAAGMVGIFIAEHATFAAEVGGCQVECGAGSSMAAAGLVNLMNGTANQAIDAASMALQNVMGMICDPVGDRVEVPCLGKNIMAGANAIACATMALSGFDKVIPLDETIESMYQVGKQLPAQLRCTGNGGLSITPTGKRIHAHLLSSER